MHLAAESGSVIIKIAGDDSDFKSKINGLGGVAKKGLGVMKTAAVAVSGALVAAGAYALKVGSSFESSMSGVAATMQLSEDEIKNCTGAYKTLHDAAIEAGATTKYSATDAADALNYLALAGYDAETAASVLPSVLNLAAAADMDLAAASDLATDAMAALNIEATKDNLTAFGDQLAQTAAKSNTSVSELGEAILTVGGTASDLAGGTTELNAVLGVLANRGTKGSEAGTALRNVILSLTAPTDKAASALNNLGIQVADAEGNMRPINDIMNDISAGLDNMTSVEKKQWLNTVFNKTDITDVQYLLAGCAEEYDSLYAAIEQSGGAMENMAKTKSENLQGALAGLQSRAETLGIAFYESVNNPLTDMVDRVADAVGQLTTAFNTDGLSGMFAELGNIAANAVQAIVASAPAMTAAAIDLFSSFTDAATSAIPFIADSANSLISTFATGIATALPSLVSNAISIVGALASGIASAIPTIVSSAISIIDAMTSGLASGIPTFLAQALPMVTEFSATLRENAGQLADAALNLIEQLAQGIANSLPVLIENIPTIVTNIAGIINDNAPKLLVTGLDIIVTLAQGIIQAIPTLVANIPQILQTIISVFSAYNWAQLGLTIINGIKSGISMLGSALQSAGTNAINTFKGIDWMGAGRAACNFIHNAISGAAGLIGNALRAVGSNGMNAFRSINWGSVGSAAINFIKSAISGAGGLVKSALQSVGQAGMNAFKNISWSSIGSHIISGICRGISGAASTLYNKLRSLASDALNAAKSALKINSPSKVFRDVVGRAIPEGIGVGVEKYSSYATNAVEEMSDKLTDAAKMPALQSKLKSAVEAQSISMTTTLMGGGKIPAASTMAEKTKTVYVNYSPVQQFDEPITLRQREEMNRRDARRLERMVSNA